MRRIHFVFAILLGWLILNNYRVILYFFLVCIGLNYLFDFIDFHKQKPMEFKAELQKSKDVSLVVIRSLSEKFKVKTDEIPEHLQEIPGPIPVKVSAIKGMFSGKLKHAHIIWPQRA